MNKITIKTYYLLTKPGIIYGNAITAIAGFFLASRGNFNFSLFLAMLFGISFVIASACVVNNYIDRDIDKKMARTKKRAMVEGSVSGKDAIIFAIILGIIGFSLLVFRTNILTAFIAFVGFFFYIVMYSICKRRSPIGTIVGSISGAVPPVVGYCAVSNHFDLGALILFLILVFWQMPHFYAIAIFRLKDYAAASLPVLPVRNGIRTTKLHMFFYILAFLFASSSLTFFGYTGKIYLTIALILNIFWLFLSIKGFRATDDSRWARKMFIASLIILTILCVVMSLGLF